MYTCEQALADLAAIRSAQKPVKEKLVEEKRFSEKNSQILGLWCWWCDSCQNSEIDYKGHNRSIQGSGG